jgi:hypothetical protein
MKATYAENLEIDRIDNDKGYLKSNCRWATRLQQVNNSRQCRLLTFQGQTLNLTQWGAQTGIHKDAIRSRINLGWSIEKALTAPKYYRE